GPQGVGGRRVPDLVQAARRRTGLRRLGRARLLVLRDVPLRPRRLPRGRSRGGHRADHLPLGLERAPARQLDRDVRLRLRTLPVPRGGAWLLVVLRGRGRHARDLQRPRLPGRGPRDRWGRRVRERRGRLPRALRGDLLRVLGDRARPLDHPSVGLPRAPRGADPLPPPGRSAASEPPLAKPRLTAWAGTGSWRSGSSPTPGSTGRRPRPRRWGEPHRPGPRRGSAPSW